MVRRIKDKNKVIAISVDKNTLDNVKYLEKKVHGNRSNFFCWGLNLYANSVKAVNKSSLLDVSNHDYTRYTQTIYNIDNMTDIEKDLIKTYIENELHKNKSLSD